MRSPPRFALRSHRESDIDSDKKHAMIPQTLAPASCNSGERMSNIKVVARIRPMDVGCDLVVTKGIGDDSRSDTRAIFPLLNAKLCPDQVRNDSMDSFYKAPLSSPTCEASVSQLAAKFSSPTSKPLAPDASTINAATTKQLFSSPTCEASVSKLTAKFNSPTSKPLAPDASTVNSATKKHPKAISTMHTNSIVKISSFIETSSRGKQNLGKSAAEITASQKIINGETQFEFDSVLDMQSKQKLAYRSCVGDAIRINIMSGINTSIIATGAPSTGKSFTMYGSSRKTRTIASKPVIIPSSTAEFAQTIEPSTGLSAADSSLNEDDGIVPRAVHDLFTAKARQATASEVSISMTFVEIRDDIVLDLLSSRKDDKQEQNSQTSTVSKNNSDEILSGSTKALTTIRLKDSKHAMLIIDAALRRKDSNESPSHTICSLNVTINPAVKSTGKLAALTSTDVISAKLTLVEIASIRKDTLILDQCISVLAENREASKKPAIVPYCDSKLTQILKDSFGGNCVTVMIACVNPRKNNTEDSNHTLSYAEKARSITNRVTKNRTKMSAITPQAASALRRENKLLKAHLLDLKKKMYLGRDKRTVAETVDLKHSSTEVFSNNHDDQSALENLRWRIKYEKLLKFCKNANPPVNLVEVNQDEEHLLSCQMIEIKTLKEQVKKLSSLNVSDDSSLTSSGATMESCNFHKYDENFTPASTHAIEEEKVKKQQLGKHRMEDAISEVHLTNAESEKTKEIGTMSLPLVIAELKANVENLKAMENRAKMSYEDSKQELESLNEAIDDRQKKQHQLRAEIKTLHQEKITMIEEIEDVQNTFALVSELSSEKEARNEIEKELDIVKKRNFALEANLKEITCEQTNSKRCHDGDRKGAIQSFPITREKRENTLHLPPLPTGSKKRKSRPTTRDLVPQKRQSTDDCTVDSSISISCLLADFKNDDDSSSVLFPPKKKSSENVDEFSASFDNQSFVSVSGSFSDEQRAIRLHAQKLLYWADKAVGTHSDDASASTCQNMNNKENEYKKLATKKICGRDARSHDGVNTLKQSITNRSFNSRQTASNQSRSCSCASSIFTGNADHAEFFLPRLGQDAKEMIKNEDPTALKSFLRSWQVAFLKSVGIITAVDLVSKYKNGSKALSKTMKLWRHSQSMKPATSKSCLIALQIWSKTAKMILRSNVHHSSLGKTDNRHSLMEISVKVGNNDQEDVSVMSMGDTLFEGELEI